MSNTQALRLETYKIKSKGKVLKNKGEISISLFLFKIFFRIMFVNVVVLGLLVLSSKIYKFCTGSPYFTIIDIEVIGNSSLSYNDILLNDALIKGENIFTFDLKGLSEKIISNSMIKEVVVSKKYPRNIVVEIKERIPFSSVKLDDVFYVTDEHGKILYKLDGTKSGYKKIIGAFLETNKKDILSKKSKKGISVLKAVYKNSLEDVLAVDISNGKKPVILFKNSEKKLILSINNVEEGILNYKILKKYIKDKKSQIRSVNMSFKDKAYVLYN